MWPYVEKIFRQPKNRAIEEVTKIPFEMQQHFSYSIDSGNIVSNINICFIPFSYFSLCIFAIPITFYVSSGIHAFFVIILIIFNSFYLTYMLSLLFIFPPLCIFSFIYLFFVRFAFLFLRTHHLQKTHGKKQLSVRKLSDGIELSCY